MFSLDQSLLEHEKNYEVEKLLAFDVVVVIAVDTADVEDTNYAADVVAVEWLHEHVLPLQHGDVAREGDLVGTTQAPELLEAKVVAKAMMNEVLLNL